MSSLRSCCVRTTRLTLRCPTCPSAPHWKPPGCSEVRGALQSRTSWTTRARRRTRAGRRLKRMRRRVRSPTESAASPPRRRRRRRCPTCRVPTRRSARARRSARTRRCARRTARLTIARASAETGTRASEIATSTRGIGGATVRSLLPSETAISMGEIASVGAKSTSGSAGITGTNAATARHRDAGARPQRVGTAEGPTRATATSARRTAAALGRPQAEGSDAVGARPPAPTRIPARAVSAMRLFCASRRGHVCPRGRRKCLCCIVEVVGCALGALAFCLSFVLLVHGMDE
mmetsp:Transcript_18904/g.43408  ORF Transcript_18904/g.43408 Transcript_18904/m.43408 type:complete len:291 (-) Transcript_18904:251-1123(-)